MVSFQGSVRLAAPGVRRQSRASRPRLKRAIRLMIHHKFAGIQQHPQQVVVALVGARSCAGRRSRPCVPFLGRRPARQGGQVESLDGLLRRLAGPEHRRRTAALLSCGEFISRSACGMPSWIFGRVGAVLASKKVTNSDRGVTFCRRAPFGSSPAALGQRLSPVLLRRQHLAQRIEQLLRRQHLDRHAGEQAGVGVGVVGRRLAGPLIGLAVADGADQSTSGRSRRPRTGRPGHEQLRDGTPGCLVHVVHGLTRPRPNNWHQVRLTIALLKNGLSAVVIQLARTGRTGSPRRRLTRRRRGTWAARSWPSPAAARLAAGGLG